MLIGLIIKKGEINPFTKEILDELSNTLTMLGHKSRLIVADEKIYEETKLVKVDLFFNLVDEFSTRAQAAWIPILCEMLHIPFTGSEGISLALAADKNLAKIVVASQDAPVAEGTIIRHLGDLDSVLLPLPLFSKPLYGSKGMGISRLAVIEEEEEFYNKVAHLLAEVDQPVLVEEFMPGREFAVGLYGEETPEVIGIMECEWAEPHKDPFIFNYQMHHESPDKIRFTCPADIGFGLATDIASIARIAWSALGCYGYAIVDIRCDENGMPHFIELDAVPSLHPTLGKLPFIAAKTGILYRELIENIINLALKRAESNNKESG